MQPGRLGSWEAEYRLDCLACRLTGWPAGKLAGRLAGSLAGWQAGRLTGRLPSLSAYRSVMLEGWPAG